MFSPPVLASQMEGQEMTSRTRTMTAMLLLALGVTACDGNRSPAAPTGAQPRLLHRGSPGHDDAPAGDRHRERGGYGISAPGRRSNRGRRGAAGGAFCHQRHRRPVCADRAIRPDEPRFARAKTVTSPRWGRYNRARPPGRHGSSFSSKWLPGRRISPANTMLRCQPTARAPICRSRR